MLGLGVDIVSCKRIEELWRRHGDRFLQRCFRPGEIAVALGRQPAAAAATLAARWAAKEALLKALGESAAGIGYRDIEVVHDPGGVPSLRLHGRAREALSGRGVSGTLVSLSHEREHAVAVVVLI